ILCIVNLDPHHSQGGMVRLPLHKINKNHDEHYIVHDLLTDSRYTWKGDWNFVDLNPHIMPMHLFRIENC
ncbi:MAG: alpha-1,4-glucan--maltose-1-phosphate maltosyltransferase, partial [Flectobacillus sp.]|nr:alpha-1,4-glucan--maltose-1-phosphate maltosyltransferase [Flectobacillus sp.]